MMRSVPEQLCKSLTWDQGAEMAQHARFTLASGCEVYFCDPHSPWQRDSNENTNGLIRDFYPKETDFRTISDEDIAHMQHLLNIRPRQTLNWYTPAEALNITLTT
ncbi:IS30 family transposase [Arcanobacterium pluranimalium]|nr:IS30 family transposase [Arcanobacterium pluranimalium]MBM7825792.1 IS30 family transposase [Arcanobacterium pluranimalium]